MIPRVVTPLPMRPNVLSAIMGASAMSLERWAIPLTEACHLYAIESAWRVSCFLAQIGHTSGRLAYTTELWGPTAAQRKYEDNAQLGNTQPGDGPKYRGHGLIKLVGRAAHAHMRDLLRKQRPSCPDFEADPQALALVPWAAMSAACLWAERGCNELADQAVDEVTFDRITKLIAGNEGRDDCRKLWRRARRVYGLDHAV